MPGACRVIVTVEEPDRSTVQQHNEEVMAETMTVARGTMPADGRGGSSTRSTRGGRERRLICSTCRGLVKGTAHVHMCCLCDVPRYCGWALLERCNPRARSNETNGRANQVTCPNPVLRKVRQDVDLQRLLEHILNLSRSVNTAQERALRDRVTTGELRLKRKSISAPKNDQLVKEYNRARRGGSVW